MTQKTDDQPKGKNPFEPVNPAADPDKARQEKADAERRHSAARYRVQPRQGADEDEVDPEEVRRNLKAAEKADAEAAEEKKP